MKTTLFWLCLWAVATIGHEIETLQSTAGVIIALPNAFFDSITGQFIEAMESKMNKEGFSLGTLRTQTYDLKFAKARFIIAENKLSAVFISRNNTKINFY